MTDSTWEAEAAVDEREPEQAGPDQPAAPAAVPPDEPRRRGPGWAMALVAALVGGAVGGGVVAALDDDSAATVVRQMRPNGSVLVERGDVQSLLAKVQPAVVSIRTEAFRGGGMFGEGPVSGAGSGMVLTAEGEVLTNAHVVEGATTIEVTLDGETKPRPATLVGGDPTLDLAIIKIKDARDLPVVELGSSEALSVGDDVVAIGNALGLPGGPTVTQGIVSGLDRSVDEFENLIQTDAAINAGNSGGPLVNAAGQVVGINTLVIEQASGRLVQNFGFAISIDSARSAIDSLRTGRVSATYLGVEPQTLDSQRCAALDHDAERCVVISTVGPGTPADAAGLQRADVIVSVDGKEVSTATQLITTIRSHQPGDKVEIVWKRDGREMRRTVTLAVRPTAS